MDIDEQPDTVVVAAGDPPPRSSRLDRAVGAGARVVAADGGVAHAVARGWPVHVAVGDFDSADPAVVRTLACELRAHDTDKDATDLELALGVAAERGPARVAVTGIEGGRPDHALAGLLVAASSAWRHVDVEIVLARGHAFVVHDELRADGPCPAFSVLPVHGPAVVSIEGARWELERELLAAGTTRGLSNEAPTGPWSVTVLDGTAAVIVPDPEESP